MLQTPFYDPLRSYDENYEKGPYGGFANTKTCRQKENPTFRYFGNDVYLPFGIPAGPLLNSNFVKGAFNKGFDIAVYKTVRSDFFPCHPFPNILSVNVEGNLTMKKLEDKLVADTNYREPLSITNSFGVPSKTPDVWQEDVKKAISYAGKGQVMVLSFMGTAREGQDQDDFIDDYALAAKLANETGAKILETNLSCPNIGNEGLVCYNISVTAKICQKIRQNIGNTPLIIKIGYFKNDKELEGLCKVANEYVDGISAINTLQAEIVDVNGNQALPGKYRLRSGVCGAAIKWAGIEMVKRLKKIKDKHNYRFAIEGVGGVIIPKDYSDYIKAGADSVMSATGAMWNPNLALEIKERVRMHIPTKGNYT